MSEPIWGDEEDIFGDNPEVEIALSPHVAASNAPNNVTPLTREEIETRRANLAHDCGGRDDSEAGFWRGDGCFIQGTDDAHHLMRRFLATIDALAAKSDAFGTQCPSCSSRGMSKLEWERRKIAKALELLGQIERHCNFSNSAAEMLTAMRSVLESS